MGLLIFSGLLYLAGIASILLLRPELMFTAEGIWKEFGIGKNPETHTWMPFWLFCILWAVISYLSIFFLFGSPALNKNQENIVEIPSLKNGKNSPKPGYYVLNTEGTGIEGVPKYIYLGQEAPG